MRAEQLTDPVAYHGEGPVWSPSWGGLRWVDMLAVERGFVLEEPDGSLAELTEVWADEQVRMNEGACDPDGRFYCGSMAYDQRPGAGTLYRLDADRRVHAVMHGMTISNGLEWSADGAQAYYNDTATHQISVFDYGTRTGLTGRRTFAAVKDDGNPDGLAVDDQGGVWTAIFNRGEVHRYDGRGHLDEVVELPVRQVTACTFGGPDLDQLFLTTSREGLDADEDPLAGSVFTAPAGVLGLPVREYAG